MIRKIALKFIILSLFIGISSAGLLAVGNTVSYFGDTEDSGDNTAIALTLDFSLFSQADFIPEVTPDQAASRTINIVQDGLLDFKYTIAVTEPVGGLCDHLTLDDGLGTVMPLVSYNSDGNEFPTTTDWEFTAALTSDDSDLQGESCSFKFVYEGTQLNDCLGFSDIEEIENTITAGEWGGSELLINKVYYDVDSAHGIEPDNEWVELYNLEDSSVNLQNWELCNRNACEIILADISIPAFGYAVISRSSGTWGYWNIPDEVVKTSHLGGDLIELDNDADMLMLKNPNGGIADQMNWGTSTSTWPNYNANVWDPGVDDVDEGHILGRYPTGTDTDTAADWRDFGLPEVVITNSLGSIWYCGGDYPVRWEANNPNGAPGELTVDIYYIIDDGLIGGVIDTNDTVYLVDENLPFNLSSNSGMYMFHVTGDYCYYGYVWVKLVVTGPENPMLNSSHIGRRIFEPPMPEEGDLGMCWIDVLAAMEAEVGPEFPEDEEPVEEEPVDEDPSEEESPAEEEPVNEEEADDQEPIELEEESDEEEPIEPEDEPTEEDEGEEEQDEEPPVNQEENQEAPNDEEPTEEDSPTEEDPVTEEESIEEPTEQEPAGETEEEPVIEEAEDEEQADESTDVPEDDQEATSDEEQDEEPSAGEQPNEPASDEEEEDSSTDEEPVTEEEPTEEPISEEEPAGETEEEPVIEEAEDEEENLPPANEEEPVDEEEADEEEPTEEEPTEEESANQNDNKTE
ncbi:lamin tail domain-containing protein [Candidatus Parcubacteria bacterium]|nr:lamin tail domain-containing protein [Candidatus Parcubacteria bacterium]